MGEIQEVQLQIKVTVEEEREATSAVQYCNNLTVTDQPTTNNGSRNYWRWIRIGIYALFVISGQAAATLLGRQYYDKGGKSNWLATLVQLAGFPILLPYYCCINIYPSRRKNPNTESEIVFVQLQRKIIIKPPNSFFTLASVYVGLGIIIAADCFLYSIGLRYLPVSTYSIICASQLAFNSFFSFFLNKQKFTPYIINSLVLLTISSTLLVFQNDSENTEGVLSKKKYAIGFICTVGAAAGYGFQLSLTQLAFSKVIKRETFKAVLDMIIYTAFVASCAILAGLFVSREWMGLNREMEEYQLGKVSYVMNLVWTAICWQIFSIGSTGLISETSSLFSNAISVVGLPVVPVLAVVFFHDKMHGLKVIAIVLAIWGFLSFGYQNYLDDYCKSKTDNGEAKQVHQPSSSGS